MNRKSIISLLGAALLSARAALAAPAAPAAPLLFPSEEFTAEAADNMVRAAAGALKPVYAPLAEQIVEDFDLADAEGIGIDLGSGPGDLILELCKRTRMHWVNADINPHCFPGFLARAAEEGLGGRVSAIFADAQALPFRDGYARIVVSRGSLQFWGDLKLGLSEVYRTLAPGGAAFIGRGLPRDMPPDVARTVREGHSKEGKGGPPPYDPDETARQLAEIMEEFGVKDYTVHRPRIEGAEDVNYGVWLEFHKPAEE